MDSELAIAYERLVGRVKDVVLSNAPLGWEEVVLTERFLYRVSEEVVMAKSVSGEVVNFSISHECDLDEIFDELRAMMYERGKGAWFTVEFRLSRSGRFSIDYDFDNEPEWAAPVVPESYVEDLERFPREPENIPAWLQEKLDAVESSRREHRRWELRGGG
ncbi:immunity protein YezG family protein [Actinomadura fibrosa]|uniref:Immunity protein YezG family protein n=1 Tax=Actinomadura fibrosa TaxID=111802 RepID=A0ABW2Y2W9_9ACTN|nr:immunity protein YezG family protein [Actinomadura fibrosa]